MYASRFASFGFVNVIGRGTLMKCPRTSLILAFILGVFLPGCNSVAPAPPTSNKEDIAEARAAFPARLQETRFRAWQTALEIVEIFERVPADQCPGVAALARDVRQTQLSLGASPERNLDRIDANGLVTRNPHFWRAALEISPSDGTLLLLQATLLASAGEIWRANRILIATTQVLPIPAGVRPYYLAQSYSLGSVILLSVRGTDIQTASKTQEAAIRLFEEALAFWPKNAVFLSELIDSRIRARLASVERVDREKVPSMIDAVLAEHRDEVDRLYALDPVSAAPYRGSWEARKKGRQLRALWSRLSGNESILGYKELGELGATLEAAEAYDLALVVYRLQVVARGFPSPSDGAAWRRLLPKLIGSEPAAALFAAVDRGELNVVELNQGTVPGVDQWKGDPAIHPLVMQQVQREIADLTFQIELLRDNPEAQVQALRQRGIQYSRAGLYEAALADLDTAMKISGREPILLIDEAVVQSAAERDEAAEQLLLEAERSPDSRPLASRERGIFRFGQGKFLEAWLALRTDARNDPKASYSAILAELAARRLGKTEREMIVSARRQLRPGSWPDLCLAFLAGKISDDALLREAQQGDSIEAAEKLCEAYFIVAQVALAAGNTAKGMDYLESCIDTGITGFVEFRLARAELKRLSPEREARTRQWEDKTPRDRPGPPRLKDKKPVEEELMDDVAPA